jgi:nitrogen regulatory protein PII
MIEFILPDEQAEKAIQVIRESGQTGHIGDGKIFVTLVERVIRVRTGESGADAV